MYCSHHFPEDYPIFDSFVEKMLMYCVQISRELHTSTEAEQYNPIRQAAL